MNGQLNNKLSFVDTTGYRKHNIGDEDVCVICCTHVNLEWNNNISFLQVFVEFCSSRSVQFSHQPVLVAVRVHSCSSRDNKTVRNSDSTS